MGLPYRVRARAGTELHLSLEIIMYFHLFSLSVKLFLEFDELAIFDTPVLRLVQYFCKTFLSLLDRKSDGNQGYQP